MDYKKKMSKVSESPIKPGKSGKKKKFDIADLYEDGPVHVSDKKDISKINLDEKIRKAYFWITNSAIITPFYDIEYNDAPPLEFTIGDSKSKLTLPTGQSYSSFFYFLF